MDTTKKQYNIERVRALLTDADTILIGAGAGLSTSAGFTYSGVRFNQNFGDFAAKYGYVKGFCTNQRTLIVIC